MKINVVAVKKIIMILLIIAIALTVAFIFSNSMKSKEESSKESGKVGDIIAEIIPPDTSLGAAIQKNLRKIAHFSEFGALGIEVALYICLFVKKRVRAALVSPVFSLIVGFSDETIQIFSERGHSITDVWIDVGGFCFFSLLSYGVIFLAALFARWIISLYKNKKALIAEENDG